MTIAGKAHCAKKSKLERDFTKRTFITYDELDEIEEEVSAYPWKPDDIFYCIDDIKEHIEPDMKNNIRFAVWLLQKTPKTEYEKESRRYLMNVVSGFVREADA